MNATALDRLCELAGIAGEHADIWGNKHRPSDETRIALLRAMGIVEDAAGVDAALRAREEQPWRRALPSVAVLREDALPYCWEIVCEERCGGQAHRWSLALEKGETHTGEFRPGELRRLAERAINGVQYLRVAFEWRKRLPLGYHRFTLHPPTGAAPSLLTLITAPGRCYTPPALEGVGRVWGPALQLYALRSARNWGIGDFTDLRNAIEIAGRAGAGIVGVNPLHALFPHNPDHISPYSPSSRAYLNVLYVDVEAVPEFAECETARATVATPEFQSRLRALRAAKLVDYRGVAEAKLSTLRPLYHHFRARHLAACTARGEAFLAYQRSGGDSLLRFALFQALQEDFHARDEHVWGWPAWPEPYRDPAAPQVRAFLEANRERVEFYAWLQWLAEEQLGACGRGSSKLGLGVGLYQDLAVSADRAGAEVWAWQRVYAGSASIGSPPDDFNLNGQNWGLPPPVPDALAECAYAPFVAMLRANMRHAGALRLDHVMGLMRLFWIPAGGKPADGAYVHYPFHDLLGVLALESRRNGCLVIGEDLGTVPDAVREALAPLGVLSYRLLLFEKERDGSFKTPAAYPAQALIAATTHDLPTLKGLWTGHDLDLRAKLALYPSDEQRERQVVQREQDRARLLVALQREGVLPAGVTVHSASAPEMTPEFALAIHTFLARSPARVMMVQMEDVLGQLEQVNLPATSAEYPNWQRKLSLNLEQWSGDARLTALAEALMPERGAARARPQQPAFETRIPDATYRLQFSRAFTFAQAADLVPYLHELGVSHLYASPYYCARPGSMHGYDIVDHNAFNPEIGNAEQFERYAQVLRGHGMGQILDMVPNHMGVMGSDNAWWLDVLENGPSSAFAAYFDIDWESAQPELGGKVLVPVLGDHYGAVLERGELKPEFDRASGAFSVTYHQHRFPVDPAEYPRILAFGLLRLKERSEAQSPQLAELEALITAFSHLPVRAVTDAGAVLERRRDKEAHKRHLASLCERSPDIAACIEESVRKITGEAGRPESFDALSELLEHQAYRLAYWRVAADDINYRRFFDINDLAALRVEDERVFEAVHRLTFQLLRDGKIDGVRIDHPDGLYDPLRYFRSLQERVAGSAAAVNGAPCGPRPLYLVIEKILADHERLPEHWPVYGTTGYRFANVVNGLFVDTAAESQFDRIYRAIVRERIDYDELLYRAKRVIMQTQLSAELSVLANRLSRVARAHRHTRDFTLSSLREALAAVVACFPVYRTYISDGVGAEDRRYVEWAVGVARKRSHMVETQVLEFVRSVLLGVAVPVDEGPRQRELRDFVMRFQQFTAPVAAKGMEDTAFYCYNRLTSLNEVGGNPRCFGMSLSAFHHASLDRARHWPHTMLATSTHDSKRSEDVRTRIDALSEFPDEWWARLQRWRRINRKHKRQLESGPAPAANDEYLLYQTLIGTWPLGEIDAQMLAAYRERIESYLLKAVREAKVHTSWMNVNEDYESALRKFVSALLDAPGRNVFIADFMPFARRIARVGMFNSLSQVVIKIASPGVPDFYQGNELWDFSLVDPDNRRPVDFDRRRAMLDELKVRFSCAPGQHAERARLLLEHWADGNIKLFVTWKGLALRRQFRSLFAGGEYLPLETRGEHAGRICAFARVEGARAVVAVAPRLIGRLVAGADAPFGSPAWADTRIVFPMRFAGAYRNIYTQERVTCDGAGELRVSDALRSFPVALLLGAADIPGHDG